MPTKPKNPCPVCRRLGCTEHRNIKYQRRPRTRAELNQNRQVVKDWIEVHGYWCPGWGVPSHPSTDLTADHIVPVSMGGAVLTDKLTVLCRACNSRRGREVQK